MSGHVLVVEDHRPVLDLWLRTLREADIPHQGCGSAEEARERIAVNGISVAVIDIGLPGEDGLSLAEWITTRHPRILVLIVTGSAEADGKELRYDVLLKPVTPRVFATEVRAMLWKSMLSESLHRIERRQATGNTLIKVTLALGPALAALIEWLRHVS